MTSIDGARAQVPASQPPVHDVPLEPVNELPTPKPFQAGVGTWAATAGAAALGGFVGVGIGGIVGLAAESVHGFGGTALVVGLGAAGLIGGGLLAYSGIRSAHESREHKKVQAEFGTSTLQYARGMMMNFDHNQNGTIDLVNSTGLESQDERVFTEERRQSQSHPKYDFWNDEWRTETERWTESRGTSAAPVWTSANVDPKDDVVTDVELARLMSQFDADRDGALTTAEQDAFNAAHPVIVDGWQR